MRTAAERRAAYEDAGAGGKSTGPVFRLITPFAAACFVHASSVLYSARGVPSIVNRPVVNPLVGAKTLYWSISRTRGWAAASWNCWGRYWARLAGARRRLP